jgi:S1-C subfamily serine protease
VTALVKRASGKTVEDRLIHREQAVGQVVALTADGWFAAPFAAVGGLRVTEMGVVWNGQVYPVVSATRDLATDMVFLKTNAQGLPSVRFVPAQDVTSGMDVWIEPTAKRLSVEMVIDAHVLSVQTVSSERATRRFLVSGDAFNHAVGGAVWNEAGGLIGLLESKTGDGWRVIPSSNLPSALSALLNKQEITHASLGVQAVDLSVLAFETTDRARLPSQGVWIKAVTATTSTLREGDVIERFERDILDGSADLGERLLEYVPGGIVTLYGLRKGVTWQGMVTLGTVMTGEKLK